MDKDYNLQNKEFVDSLTPNDIQAMFEDIADFGDVLMAKGQTRCGFPNPSTLCATSWS